MNHSKHLIELERLGLKRRERRPQIGRSVQEEFFGNGIGMQQSAQIEQISRRRTALLYCGKG
ncbi:MAG TPA: hypothetical protein VJW55_02600, partial [Candidatus Angelobacter sp.]|nr:hypothetical protein [Candidatus Angelobacter sp.]